MYKYGASSAPEQHAMQDLAKMFLMCINKWKLDTPSLRKLNNQVDDVSIYKVNYTRLASILPNTNVDCVLL